MKKLKIKELSIIVASLIFAGFIENGCTNSNAKDEASFLIPQKATVSGSGDIITFPENSPGLDEFRTTQVKKSSAVISVLAPGRVVATFSSAGVNIGKIVLFDSPDITSLYSQYKQNKASYQLATKNLARTKEMFANQAATEKDMNQAENDFATAHAAMVEMDVRLRAVGFNPEEIESISSNYAWIMADVPELQIHQIRKGESVKIKFDAYPDKVFTGKADAIGDILDPNTRTVKVRVIIPNIGGKFIPGMFAQVDFGNPISSAFILPLSAIVTVEEQNYLFVKTKPNVFERRQVVIANSDPEQLIVLSGIQDSEKVVTSGAMLLKGLSFGY